MRIDGISGTWFEAYKIGVKGRVATHIGRSVRRGGVGVGAPAHHVTGYKARLHVGAQTSYQRHFAALKRLLEPEPPLKAAITSGLLL